MRNHMCKLYRLLTSCRAMSMRRYLANISYIGTPFRGSQRQVKGGTPRENDPSTVQGLLEMGLKHLNPKSDTVVFMASRTDAGVHAINATCHFDLYRPENRICEPNEITSCLNGFFSKRLVSIRILNTRLVPDDFHCKRNSISRTYLYRAIVALQREERQSKNLHFFPLEERNRAYFTCAASFDIDIMREAAKMFEGFHDYRTFMGKVQDDDRLTRRSITSIQIIERKKEEIGVSPSFSWPAVALNNCGPETHAILDMYFKGPGFLYRQVRRTGGTLLAAATGKISLRDIRFMLEVPSKNSWDPRIQSLPGQGLYLCEIEY